MRTNRKNRLKIIAASSVAIFSLAALVGGAFAWFTLVVNSAVSSDPFAVINLGSCDLYSIELIKFDYKTTVYGSGEGAFTIIDYLTPKTGKVNKYTFDKTRNSFGYTDSEEVWHSVDSMNTFDPVNLLIYSSGLIGMNCNAIYKFTVSTTDMTDVSMSATIHKLLDRTKLENEIFLSACTDFDLFFPSVLSDSNPDFIIEDDPSTPEDESLNPYYPSYIDKSESLTELEDIYYKISYLADKKASHAHLYGTGENDAPLLDATDVTFIYDETGTGFLSFYVNVNYAPSELEEYKTKIYQDNIKAIFDYGFRFYFFRQEGE